jgi:hypothetical protein
VADEAVQQGAAEDLGGRGQAGQQLGASVENLYVFHQYK